MRLAVLERMLAALAGQDGDLDGVIDLELAEEGQAGAERDGQVD
jgi:hypothetical protein